MQSSLTRSARRRPAARQEKPTNTEIAALLEQIGDLLDVQGENPFRIRSYRTAAESVRSADQPLARLFESGGTEALTAIRGIGERLAALIQEYLETGTVELLETLQTGSPATAQGAKPRASGAKTGAKTGHARPAAARTSSPGGAGRRKNKGPSADLILAVDEEYRAKAAAGSLKKIAPKNLNPGGEAWLPIMSARHEGYRFTAMFSNTANAHEAGKTNDWVVVYFKDESGEEQCTVVTEQRGPLKGKRVIRGREKESAAYYAADRTAGRSGIRN